MNVPLLPLAFSAKALSAEHLDRLPTKHLDGLPTEHLGRLPLPFAISLEHSPAWRLSVGFLLLPYGLVMILQWPHYGSPNFPSVGKLREHLHPSMP